MSTDTAPSAQKAAESDVLAALQFLTGKGYTSASLTVMTTAPAGIANPGPGQKGPVQAHRKHSIAVSGTMDKDGNISVAGKAANPVNQPAPNAPIDTASPAPIAKAV